MLFGVFAPGGDPKTWVPLFFVFLGWGFARGDPTRGFLFLLGACSVCFLLGSSSVFRALLLPPEKVFLAPH